LELVEGVERVVFEGLAGELPQPLGGLKLWGIGGLSDGADAVRDS